MKKSFLVAFAIILSWGSYARKSDGIGRPVNNGLESDRAADCSPATEKVFLEFNNIRALIETGGMLWQDRANDRASYEYPKASGNYLIYSGALWIGGQDITGNLKLAAHLFRQNGNDFWPGPLRDLNLETGNYDPSTEQSSGLNLFRPSGAGIINRDECEEYDKFFTIRKAEVLQFIAWWKCDQGISSEDDCEGVEKPSPDVMDRIVNWPAHGDTDLGQDYYLAPFYDNALPGETANGRYDPLADGDYPWYDLNGDVNCRSDRRVTLYGDETHWWVFNDKGNIHTETGGRAIGMEVHAQAFSFATDDEVNDMTFYNYEVINRGTQTLYQTYFGQFVDADAGFDKDDYVGCDVSRGLGYVYNSDLNDEGGKGGQPGYGSHVPAVGVDFFEGPYLDNDGIDNPLYKAVTDDDGPAVSLADVYDNDGIPYPGLGIGYGDEIVDNERFGMARFVYFERTAGENFSDPSTSGDFYNYLQGIWKNGSPMEYGGTGYPGSSGIPTKYMFPGDSDPLNWGVYPASIPPGDQWSEVSAGNPGGDRRFIQAAGPFTLKPGAVNNITVGVVVGQSSDADIEAPVRALKTADTKAQALFDNCFEIIEPPLAPVLTIQEMENELILFLSDPKGTESLEMYVREDYRIDTAYDDNKFRFEGFQIFQMVDEFASVTDLGDLSKARLVAQTDVQNGVGKLVNYTLDEELGISIPAVMVEPAADADLDEGLRRSFRITEDLFASGSRTLVNHKKYYYIAVSYAHNEFKEYDPTDPNLLDGQKRPYLRSRISGTGSGIESVIGIPHDPTPEADGRIFTTNYGFQPEITQIEGIGNGGTFLELTQGTVDQILANNKVDHPIYQSGAGPIDVKVVDPLNLVGGNYTLKFGSDSATIDEDTWVLIREWDNGGTLMRDSVSSKRAINVVREELILDWGISVTINQQFYKGGGSSSFTEPIGATMTFQDSSKIWLTTFQDDDNYYPSNWILTGTSDEYDPLDDSNPLNTGSNWIYQPGHYDDFGLDKSDQLYEQMLDGGIAPFKFVAAGAYGSPYGFPGENTSTPWYKTNESWFSAAKATQNLIKMEDLHEVDIVITRNKELWTNCPVIEINDNLIQTEHGDAILQPRGDKSVDKQGKNSDEGGDAGEIGEFETGMGWFPGYAIDVNTGERLNMVFAENSWLVGDNGRDMIWNPTNSYADNAGVPLFGGMHYIYVFGANTGGVDAPVYDRGSWLRKKLENSDTDRVKNYREAWKTCFWVMEPRLVKGQELLSTDVKISARIKKPYVENAVNGENGSFPMYQFGFDNPSIVGDGERLVSVIDDINIVPNPYYAYSDYETGKRDNRVKITNLPERCELTIFNMQGALVRSFVKDDPLTSIDWDLKNHQGIPIAGGMYIVHVKIDVEDESGAVEEYEKILKWYGALRQVDLDNL